MMRGLIFIFLLLLAPLFPATAQEDAPTAENEAPLWWSAVLADTQLPIGRMQETLEKACRTITEKALTPVPASRLAFESVKSLSTIDQKIGVFKDGTRVLISADGRILKSFSAPPDDDCADWSRLTLAALVTARPFSPKAQQSNAEDILNIFLNASLAVTDAYAHYEGTDPAELKRLEKPASIGIRYRRTGKYLEITEILPDSPASRSELAVGDRIARIDGRPITDLSRVEILNLLRGEKDSDVTLNVRKDGKMKSVNLVRMPVSSSPVSYYYDEERGIMTIRISAFTPKTVKALRLTLNEVRDKKAKALIIDLRGNTGGLLKEAVLAADLFLPAGLPLIKTAGRHHETVRNFQTTSKKVRPVYPIAVLVDGKTASSAEFFAGALQDYRHAVLIGTTTYGKGVIQTVETLPNGGDLYLTWSKFELPSNYSPDRFGLYPNICTSGRELEEIGKVPPPLTALQQWRTGSDKTKDVMRSKCRPESRANNPLDDEFAAQLVLNPDLYERSLTYFSLDSFLK